MKKSKLVQGLLASLVLVYVRAVFATIRWDVVINPQTDVLIKQKQPFLFSFWHGRLIMMSPAWRQFVNHTHMSILVSGHEDGEFAGKTLQYYNIGFLRGSSRRGAVAGGKAVMRSLNKGHSVAITVDGPRGPRMRMGSGICKMARLSGVPIVPVCFSTSKGINARSWDAMLIPLPFCKGFIHIDTPMYVTDDLDLDPDQLLENRLVEQQKLCDHKMGRPEILPASK